MEQNMPESEHNNHRFQIGYALPPKKVTSLMTPSLINHAKHQGIDLIPINISTPLTDHHQPSFDIILHKINTHEWNMNLNNYALVNPKTVIIDPVSNITRLHNRVSMLDFINSMNIEHLSIPDQTLVSDSVVLSSLMNAGGLKFPMIAKPVAADGSVKSHEMSLVLNKDGLSKVDVGTPVVLQQFVNHGGVIFKVYVAGEYVKCVKRSSLGDISNEKLEKMALEVSEGVVSFSKISNSAMAREGGGGGSGEVEMEMPRDEFVEEVANGMRRALGLRLFNFDMIRDENGDYLVIDINYFPGYEKLDSYETVMTDFLLNVMKSRARGGGEDGASETQ